MRDERIGLAVDRSLQNESVLRIRELRAPAEVHLYAFGGAGERRQEPVDLIFTHARRETDLGTFHDVLVLQEERRAHQRAQPAASDLLQDRVARAGSTA